MTLPETSPTQPALTFEGLLYVSWKGDGNNFLNVESSGNNGQSFGGKFTLPELSAQAPSLCSHNGRVYLGWPGSGTIG